MLGRPQLINRFLMLRIFYVSQQLLAQLTLSASAESTGLFPFVHQTMYGKSGQQFMAYQDLTLRSTPNRWTMYVYGWTSPQVRRATASGDLSSHASGSWAIPHACRPTTVILLHARILSFLASQQALTLGCRSEAQSGKCATLERAGGAWL